VPSAVPDRKIVGLRLRIFLGATVALAALAVAPAALARSAGYVFEGGTSAQRAQVTRALDASSFDWRALPSRITVHIARGLDSEATPGHVWLDANLLDSGRFSWGVVQHEFAHQVDFLLLTDAQRGELAALLHVAVWCPGDHLDSRHGEYGCERFASTFAWAYWQSPDNVMRPRSASDESSAMTPTAFRATVKRLLLARQSTR
jgi:hypothetical protein